MYFFSSKICNIIRFILVIYFTPTVVGPRGDPAYNPMSILVTPTQQTCFKNIHEVFIVEQYTHLHEKEYFKYALKNLRELSSDEVLAYYRKYGPVPEEVSPYLLYNGYFDTYIDNIFVHQYFKTLSTEYLTNAVNTPETFCAKLLNFFLMPMDSEKIIRSLFTNVPTDYLPIQGIPVGSMSMQNIPIDFMPVPGIPFTDSSINNYSVCQNAIEQYGLIGKKQDIVGKAYLTIVENDLNTTAGYFTRLYLYHIHDKVNTTKDLLWPEDFCFIYFK